MWAALAGTTMADAGQHQQQQQQQKQQERQSHRTNGQQKLLGQPKMRVARAFAWRDREDRNLFWVFLGAFCWAPRIYYIQYMLIHTHTGIVNTRVCVCVRSSSKKPFVKILFSVCLLRTCTQNTLTHTHSPSSAAHTHNPFPWNVSLFCRHFLCASLSVRACGCVCECVWKGVAERVLWGVWHSPSLVVLLVLVLLVVPSSDAPKH